MAVGGAISISAVGDISGTGEGPNITADTAKLNAIGGSVGSEGALLDTDVSKALTAAGTDVHIQSDSSIKAGNMLARGDGENAAFRAGGTLELRTPGEIIRLPGASFLYGTLRINAKDSPSDNTVIGWRVLEDEATGIRAEGYLTQDARLSVKVIKTKEQWTQQLSQTSGMNADLSDAWDVSGRTAAYAVELSGGHVGSIRLSLPAERVPEGKYVYVLCIVEGRLTVFRCPVVDGRISFTADGQKLLLMVFEDESALLEYLEQKGLTVQDVTKTEQTNV